MRGVERETPAGWMRGDEAEAVNFTLKLWGGGEAARVIRTETNGGRGGGERAERALHSAQRGGD